MMNLVRQLLLRLRAVVGRRGLERDMQLEIRAHLDQATERFIARGLSPREARIAARREFGNVAVVADAARDARGARWVEDLVADLRFAVRHFARTPLVTATIVFVLALGIGVNSALFSVLQAFTMRPAPAVPKNDSHVRIYGLEQAARGVRWQLRGLSYPELLELAATKETFTQVAGWTAQDVIIDRGDRSGPRGVGAEFVTPNFWSALGVAIIAGPGFAADDPRAPDLAAVISFALSEEWFASPSAAIGQRILVNDVPVRIVGVAPPRFQGAIPNNGRPAVWLPISARADVARISARWLTESSQLSVFARLAAAVTPEQASAVARSVATRLQPDSVSRSRGTRTAQVLPMRSAPPATTPDDPLIVFTAMGVIALLILLVACTNVSSLLVAAAVGRRHEIAVRLSLGASRARLLRQLLTETTLLAIAGGAGGLLLYWGITTFVATRVASLSVEIAPDLLTVVFTMTVALGTGVLFGLSPALHATRAGVATALRDSGAGVTGRSRLQRAFVVAQIVFSQPLLVLLAMLLVAALPEGQPIPDAVRDRVISARFRPLGRTGPVAQRQPEVEMLTPRIGGQPGVVGIVPEPAAFTIRSITLPPSDRKGEPGAADAIRVHVEGTPPGYFSLLDVPIVLGRDVSLADTTGTDYAIVVGSDLARTLWADANPVGKRLASTDWKAGARDSVGMVVVGVFDATHPTTRGSGTRVYTAHGAHWRRDALLVRTRGLAQMYVPSLQSFIRASAPGLPVSRIETLTDISHRDHREALQLAGAVTAAGALALFVASIGLYGVVSLAVGQRTREIGIRIALGGKPSRVAGMFLASGLRVSVIALLIGLPITVLAARVAMSEGIVIAPNFNLSSIGGGIAALVLVVAAAASWVPARRAAAVDPSLALRAE